MKFSSVKMEELVKAGEVSIKTGPFGTQLKASEYVSDGVPVLNVKNLGYASVLTDKLDRVGSNTLKRLDSHVLRCGDIVFGRKGAVDRHAYIGVTEDGWMQGSDCIRIRTFSNRLNPRYLSYYFLTSSHRKFMVAMCAHGTTMASLSQKILEQIELPIPERNVQDAIVNTLSVIDDKIELNQRINVNLQQQAQAIYSEMFNDCSVGSGSLGEIADITMGQSPNGDSYNEDGIGEVFYQGRAEFGFRFPTRRLFTTEPKRMAEVGDILLSVRAPVGDLNVAYEHCCVGRGLGAIHSKDGNSSFLLYTMFSLKPQLDVFNGEGTVFGSINRNALNAMPISIPDVADIATFEEVVRPMD